MLFHSQETEFALALTRGLRFHWECHYIFVSSHLHLKNIYLLFSGVAELSGDLKDAIVKTFGSVEEFKTKFMAAGATQFGSGWAWLVVENGALSIVKTANAENPITSGVTPILTMDVWEHAYYLGPFLPPILVMDSHRCRMVTTLCFSQRIERGKHNPGDGLLTIIY